ncbi:MAG TPA: hypothetical protein DCP91_07915 [Eggerthellaceae bacterium]|nr:hypothetical protein [Eggerthellaceae bacterium]
MDSRMKRFRRTAAAKLCATAAFAVCLLALQVALCWPGACEAWADGTFAADYANPQRGTEQAPYRIASEQDLRDFAKVVNGAEPASGAWVATGSAPDALAGKFVSLESDIVLEQAAVPIGIGSNATTAGPAARSFSGTFLGNNHTIGNWYATAATNPVFGDNSNEIAATKHAAGAYSAPFGAVAGAAIHDLNVALKPDATYAASNVAGLVAFVGKGTTTIERCSVVGDLSVVGDHVGGLVASFCTDYGSVGTAQLVVARCFHVGDIAATGSAAGGIVGYIGAAGVSVAETYQHGNVASTKAGTQYFPSENYWGAIVGSGGTYATRLTGCVASQDAQLHAANATRVTLTGCLAGVTDWDSDDVKAALGGESGAFDFSATQGGTLPPPFKSDAVTKIAHGIGFAKGADGVSGMLPTVDPATEGTVIALPGAGSGSSALSRNGFDFAGWLRTDVDDDATVYAAGDPFTMPDCAVEFTAQWTPRQATVFTTEDQLRDFAISVNAGTLSTAGNVYALGSDISLEQDFVPIGAPGHEFRGVFRGDGHVVRGLKVSGDSAASSSTASAAGLFGSVRGAVIDNLGVECAIDAASCDYAGGLVGQASGAYSASADDLTRITGCFVRGSVKGGTYVGGLVGSATFTVIQDCYASGSVVCASSLSKAAVGGLVGNLVRGASHSVAPGAYILGASYAACEVLATAGAVSKGALVGRAYSVNDETLNADVQWPLFSNVWALDSTAPAYTFGAGGSEMAGTPVAAAVSAGMTMNAAALSGAAGTLGAGFKDDAQSALLQANGGFPVLSWEPALKAGKLQLFVVPHTASVVVADDATGAELDVASLTHVEVDGQTAAAFTYSTVSSHAYTAHIEAEGFEPATERIAASESPVSRTVLLQLAAYAIRYEKAGARWAAGFVPTMTYTAKSADIALPTADQMVWDGYRFLGWHAARDFSDDALDALPAGSTGDKVFYAKWENIAAAEEAQERAQAQDALQDAQDALVAYAVSADGSDVAPGTPWVTQEMRDAVLRARAALQQLVDSDAASAEEVRVAREALVRALADLAASAQDGTKADADGGEDAGGSAPSADSGTGDADTGGGPGPSGDPDAGGGSAASAVRKGATFKVGGMAYVVTKMPSAKAAGAVKLVRARNAATVAVPASIRLADNRAYRVTVVATGAFKGLSKVRAVMLGKNVATVQTKALRNLKNLTRIVVGAGVRSLQKSAFFKTPKLKTLVVKSTKLKKVTVKAALKGSKLKRAITIKAPKAARAKYRRAFTKANLKSPKPVALKLGVGIMGGSAA